MQEECRDLVLRSVLTTELVTDTRRRHKRRCQGKEEEVLLEEAAGVRTKIRQGGRQMEEEDKHQDLGEEPQETADRTEMEATVTESADQLAGRPTMIGIGGVIRAGGGFIPKRSKSRDRTQEIPPNSGVGEKCSDHIRMPSKEE